MSEIRWDRRKYTKEEFKNAFNNSSNWNNVIDKLGLKRYSNIVPSLKQAAEELGLDYSNFSNKRYTCEILSKAVENSFSVAGVVRYLGLKQAGGTQANIAKRIKEFNIDTSHFKRQAHNKGKVSSNRKAAEEIFVLGVETDNRTKREKLKRCMVEVGIDYICNSCGLKPFWNGKELKLDVNHINGMFWDNRQENLEFLCPNCHRQETETNRPHKYRGKVKSED